MVDYSKRLTIVIIMAILIVLLIFIGHNEDNGSKKINMIQIGQKHVAEKIKIVTT